MKKMLLMTLFLGKLCAMNTEIDVFKACETGDLIAVQKWVKNQGDLTIKNSTQESLLHQACSCMQLNIVKYLTKESKDLLYEKDSTGGWTPLHVACSAIQMNPEDSSEDAWEIIYHLLNEGADLSIKQKCGESAYVLFGTSMLFETYKNSYHTLRKKFIDFSMVEKLYALQKLENHKNSKRKWSKFDILPNDVLGIIKTDYIKIALKSVEAQLWRLVCPKLILHNVALSLPENYFSAWQNACENDEEWNKKIANIVCLWPYAIKESISKQLHEY